MGMQNKKLETQADLPAEVALPEHDSTPFDELDDYAKQCSYAGCRPSLPEAICAHPHDSVIFSGLWTSEGTEEAAACFC